MLFTSGPPLFIYLNCQHQGIHCIVCHLCLNINFPNLCCFVKNVEEVKWKYVSVSRSYILWMHCCVAWDVWFQNLVFSSHCCTLRSLGKILGRFIYLLMLPMANSATREPAASQNLPGNALFPIQEPNRVALICNKQSHKSQRWNTKSKTRQAQKTIYLFVQVKQRKYKGLRRTYHLQTKQDEKQITKMSRCQKKIEWEKWIQNLNDNRT